MRTSTLALLDRSGIAFIPLVVQRVSNSTAIARCCDEQSGCCEPDCCGPEGCEPGCCTSDVI